MLSPGANPNLQLQRQRCRRLEHFFKVNMFVFKTHYATRGVVNFYNAGVLTHGRRNGSSCLTA
jgi:hypothetical protein